MTNARKFEISECETFEYRYVKSNEPTSKIAYKRFGRHRRFLSAVYHDGVQSVRRSTSGRPLPSARDITSLIHEDQDIPLASVTHMLMQWGQFVDHDLTGVSLENLFDSLFTITRIPLGETVYNYIFTVSTATGQSRGFNGSVPQCCLPGGVGFQPPEFMVTSETNNTSVSNYFTFESRKERPVLYSTFCRDRRALNLPCFDVSGALNREFTNRDF